MVKILDTPTIELTTALPPDMNDYLVLVPNSPIISIEKLNHITGNLTQNNINGTANKTNSNKGVKFNTRNQNNTLTNTQTNKIQGKYEIPNTMYPHRNTPLSGHEINSNNHMVNDLLKRAVSNAFRHGLNLRPGRLNSVNGNCVWESITYNVLERECVKNKTKDNSKQLRTRSINLAQAQLQWLPFMESNTTEAE